MFDFSHHGYFYTRHPGSYLLASFSNSYFVVEIAIALLQIFLFVGSSRRPRQALGLSGGSEPKCSVEEQELFEGKRSERSTYPSISAQAIVTKLGLL